MFVYSMRASTLKFFGVIILSVITLIILIAFIPTIEPSSYTAITANQKINYANIKTNEDRIAFLSQFGHKVRPEPVEEIEITIPGVFDRVMMEYNTLQKQQGFDLSKYERKKLTRYTYIVEGYNGYDGTVYANILVFRGKVVGGDICSADINGFVDEL
ncbi:MAG: DUF4830 domain-containing protein [Eubacteriales bacterium]